MFTINHAMESRLNSYKNENANDFVTDCLSFLDRCEKEIQEATNNGEFCIYIRLKKENGERYKNCYNINTMFTLIGEVLEQNGYYVLSDDGCSYTIRWGDFNVHNVR